MGAASSLFGLGTRLLVLGLQLAALVTVLGPISAAAMDLIVGTPAEPLGAAKNVFAVCDANVAVSVPVVVTGDPDTVNIDGRDSPTLVTGLAYESVPEPLFLRNPDAFANEPNVVNIV